MNRAALIIFQKNAVLGKVKTRLATSVGDEKALEVYEWLTAYTHEQVVGLNVDKFLFYSDFIPEYPEETPNDYHVEVQLGQDLGDRMKNAFMHLFAKGYNRVVIIGTDCPYLTSKDLKKAFLNLGQADMVLGPAKDGGYYLLGMSGFFPEIFEDIPWSTSKVLEKTLDVADKLKVDYEFLKILSDIDTQEDWKVFKSLNKITRE
jgi:rSAM/selenodomain-associated transferase 1